MRRCIGLDVHREFAQVATWEDGVVWQAGRIQTTPEALRAFAASLCVSDEVALEATGNTHAIARLLEQHVGRVVVSNPQKTRAIAEARSRPTRLMRRCWRGCWRLTTCRRCGCPMTRPTRCAARSPAGPTSCGSGPG
jgi:transposase